MISRYVLAAPAATVTFSAIPATYENLVLVGMGATTDAALAETAYVRFNGDTAANYDWQQLYANGATVTGSATVADTKLTVMSLPGATAPAGEAGNMRVTIPSYARTTFYKTYLSDSFYAYGTANTDLFRLVYAGVWHSAAAITSVTVFEGGAGNFATGSVFSLYGEK